MKVLHLVWNLIRGGTEGQCARVAMELAGRGEVHRVVVFRREGFFLPAVEAACGPVEEIGIRGFCRWSTWTAIRRLAKQAKREGFDLLHAWDADAAIFGQMVAGWSGLPLITSRRDLGEIYSPYKRVLMHRADRRARLVVANAEAIADHFAAQGTPRDVFRVIPNILDLEEFDRLAEQPFARASDLPPGDRVVMVARLDPEKDVPTFIEAAERARKAHPGVSFVVAGAGGERPRLERMAGTHGLAGIMVFLGEVTDIPALLTHCRVGVLTPSRNEGLSNTLLEYMAAGLPVVATECGGNREVVQPPDGGMIVPVGDAEALAGAVLDLLRKPTTTKVIGEFNRWRVLQGHQPKAIGDRFEAVYREVLGGRG